MVFNLLVVLPPFFVYIYTCLYICVCVCFSFFLLSENMSGIKSS